MQGGGCDGGTINDGFMINGTQPIILLEIQI